MRLTYDGVEIEVRWKHYRNGGRDEPGDGVEWTACRVIYPRRDGFGTAWCHPSDVFCKDTGRKVSLAAALQGEPKPLRTAIWAAYFARKEATS